MSKKLYEDDLISSESNEGKLRLELRKLSNSDAWVSTTNESSTSNSRTSTPLSLKSTGGRRQCTSKKVKAPKHKKSSGAKLSKPKHLHKPKKFRMVLEKDDDFEVDYLSPDEAESSSSSVCKDTLSVDSLSDTEFMSNDDDVISAPELSHNWLDDETNNIEEEEDIPLLVLPKSSDDLLLPNDLVLSALGVYEVFRHFRNSLRLSPFLFEDFCAALMSNETTVLLNECHISLLKTILKEEESFGTLFVPLDQKDAYNMSLYFIDYLTWPEVVRSYLQSSPEFAHVLPIVEEESFPCVEASKKIKVLQLLTDIFLSSMKIRDELMMNGTIRYDDHCRVCHRLGDLLCCESCPAVYHLACCDPPLQEVPEEEWQCEVCVAHKLNGVSNCESESEISSQYLRHDPVGLDRHGRKYWFLVRRLFVESENEVFYYTTYEEFKHVLSKLDHLKYEMVLCEALKDVLEEFPRQAKVTEELTNEACWKDDQKTQIEVLKENLLKLAEKEKEAARKLNTKTDLQSTSSSQPSADNDSVTEKSNSDTNKDLNGSQKKSTEETTSEKEKVSSVITSDTAAISSQSAESVSQASATSTSSSAVVTSTSEVVTSSTGVVSASNTSSASIRPAFPKSSFIPLSIKVPLTRCDAMVQPKQQPLLNQVLKINPKVHLKPASSTPVTTLKNLFVLSKDGVKTPLTIGSDGKLTTGNNQRLIMINPAKSEPSTPQSRLNRELKRLQFSGAGPKMYKMTSKSETPSTLKASISQGSLKEQASALSQPNRKPFRLGEDGGYKQYKNYFFENTLALNKYQHKEEKDKERHVGYKFSLTGPVEFDWGGRLCGTREDIVHALRSTLFSLEQQIPLCFMHARWEQYRKMWGRMLVQNDSVKAFSAVLGILEMAIRDNAKKTVWKEGLGQVRMRRLPPDEKELYEKKKKHKLRLADDVAQRNAVWCKYPLPVKSNLVWKMRGEEYRITGYGGWMWVSATFRSLNRKPESKPFTLFKTFSTEKVKDDSMDVDSTPVETLESETQKFLSTCDVLNVSKNLLVRSVAYNKRWSPSKVDKLLRWRILQEKERMQKQEVSKTDTEKEVKTSPAPPVTSDTPTSEVKQPKPVQKSETLPHESPEISDDENPNTNVEKMKVDGEDESNAQHSSKSDDQQSKTVTQENSSHVVVDANNSKEDVQMASDECEEKTNQVKQEENLVVDNNDEKLEEVSDVSEQDKDTQLGNKPDTNEHIKHETDKEITPMKTEEASSQVVENSDKNITETDNELTDSQKPSVDAESPKPNHIPEHSNTASEAVNECHKQSNLNNDLNSSHTAEQCETEISDQNQHNDHVSNQLPDQVKTKNIDDNDSQMTDHVKNNKEQSVSIDNHKENVSKENDQTNNHVQSLSSVENSDNNINNVDVTSSDSTKLSSEGDVDPIEVEASDVVQSDEIKQEPDPSLNQVSNNLKEIEETEDTVNVNCDTKPTLSPKSASQIVTAVSTSTSIQQVEGDVLTETLTTTTTTSIKTVSSLQDKQPPSKHVTQSSESVEQVSTTIVDDVAGQATETNQVYKVSRRFRRSEVHGVRRQSSTLSESSSILSKTWKLVKSPADSNKKKLTGVKMPIPWNFAFTKDGRRSIFRLPRSLVRHMVTRGGLAWYPLGFRHVQKSPTSLELFWPYRCVRPTIGTVWRYKLKNAKTLSSIAHLLRIIWHSMRWEDIVTKPSTDDVIHTIFNDDDIVSIELLKRRNVGNTGLHSEYFVRRIVMPSTDYDEEIPRSEAYTPSSRSGLRTRSRQMNLRERSKKELNVVQPKVETLWMSEDQIQLWQIRQFDSMVRLQQKAAAARKEAEAKEAANKFAFSSFKQKREIKGVEKIDGVNVERIKTEPIKHITISPALLQQAAALHRSQTSNTTLNTPVSKIISLDLSQISGKLTALGSQNVLGSLQKLAMKPSTVSSPQFVTIKTSNTPSSVIASPAVSAAVSSSALRAGPNARTFIQTTKMMPKKILLRPSVVDTISDQKPRHPTIKLAGVVGSTRIQPVASTLVSTTKETLISPKPLMPQQAILPSAVKSGSSMQVKLSPNQLNDLMRVGPQTTVKVSITMPDGSPGVGHLQVIPQGSQVTPNQGQQLMQCKVGNEIKRFLLTAAPLTKGSNSTKSSESYTADNEVSLETPSLRLRLEQLQQRHQELTKPSSNNVHRLMTDKDPLWGGRTQHADKSSLFDKMGKKDMSDRVKRKYTHSNESKEERQRRNVVQQVVKSLLDRIERKEELEARRRKREEREEMQKRKKENIDMQRIHSRLYHALVRHEDQLKQDIRKRRSITEKHLTHIVENELHEDQLKRKKLSENITSPSRKINQNVTKTSASHVLTERNKKELVKGASPKKMKRKRSPSPVENMQPQSPANKKRKMINSSVKLYCVCQTPYDDTRFYIGCDLCMNWFHGECVGIGERKAKHMDTWVCRDCQQTTPQEELYCVCKTPYDDAQFYIGCDICQDWFHGRCVGISEDQAESIESYTCPRCKKETRFTAREKSLSLKEVTELTKIVRHLQNHKMAWPFLEPVREVDAPGYYKMITRPMDLQTVMKRLQCKYYSKLSDLVGDVSLIFDNCRQYNGPESNVVKCAEIVETVFVGRIRDMRGR